MKFTISSHKLFKYLQYFNGIINYNNSISILNNLLFKVKDNELFVIASDLEVTIITKIDIINYDKNGKIAVPAKLIINTLKNLPEQPITFYSENEHILNIISRYGNYTITIEDAETFPNINNINYLGKIKLSTNTLSKIIDKTLFATGNDDFRQVLTGVFFYITPNESIFVSTDSNKLVKYVRKDIKNNQIAKLIIPKKPLKILKSILNKKKEEIVTIYYNENNTTFSLSDKTLICKLINGNYPNYESVIPNNNDKKLIINKNVFLNSIKRISLFSSKKNYQICLHLKYQTLNLIAKDIEFSNKAFETLKCDYTGKDFKIGFNSKFLIDMISHIDGENIIFEMSQPNLSVILKPFDYLDEEEELLMLVMPYYL
ncbi:MAG: DNA polymerase III subunit beta [Candidatus Bostrichicola ureolyticus]|nr:MAG: DNA polymerase III subunit beta [Candidatus Bostrichicola ureolyticus]